VELELMMLHRQRHRWMSPINQTLSFGRDSGRRQVGKDTGVNEMTLAISDAEQW